MSAGVVRWRFHDLATSDEVMLPLNPNTMTTPTKPRNLSWAWGTKIGIERMRGFDAPSDSAPTWQFGGVILTESHYELLLAWAGRLTLLQVDDHLGRQFKVVIQKFDPVERLPTATRKWRATYTMTCLFLERIS